MTLIEKLLSLRNFSFLYRSLTFFAQTKLNRENRQHINLQNVAGIDLATAQNRVHFY